MDETQAGLVALVAIGGAIGSVARYGVSGLLSRSDFPWGTFAVNLTGTFLLSFLYFLSLERGFQTTDLRTFLFVGVFGGYTTFSTFTYETLALLQDGERRRAAANVAASVVLGLAAVAFGFLAGGRIGGGS